MRHVSERSLANLRPVSATPERARAFAKLHGIGGPLDKRKRCQGTRTDGGSCGDLAAFGTPYCVKHGARSVAKMPARAETRAARQALAFLEDAGPPPPDLAREPAWIAAGSGMGMNKRVTRQAALRRAWDHGTETGDWKPWRNLAT